MCEFHNGELFFAQVASASFTTINASALVHPEDALCMFTYHKVLIDAPEDDLYINLRPAPGIQSITAYLACEVGVTCRTEPGD